MSFLSDRWRRFKDGLASDDNGAETPNVSGALAAARRVDQQALQLPEGSPARARLVQLAEELRAYAAGEAAKATLARYLADPEIARILQLAGIRID